MPVQPTLPPRMPPSRSRSRASNPSQNGDDVLNKPRNPYLNNQEDPNPQKPVKNQADRRGEANKVAENAPEKDKEVIFYSIIFL